MRFLTPDVEAGSIIFNFDGGLILSAVPSEDGGLLCSLACLLFTLNFFFNFISQIRHAVQRVSKDVY